MYDGAEIYQVISSYDCGGRLLSITQTIPNGYIVINTQYSELASVRNGVYRHEMGDTKLYFWEQDGYMFTLSMQGNEKAEHYINSIEVYL